MANFEIIHENDVKSVPDLIHRVRGLRFFMRHVSDGIRSIGRREGLVATFDERRAASVFLAWVEEMMKQRPASRRNRRDYIIFSTGLLLEHLLTSGSIDVTAPPDRSTQAGAAISEAARFWPEGYLATAYCMTALDIVLTQEGFERCELQPIAGELSTWWSFRENFREDPHLVVPFFDLMIGNKPNWTRPSVAAERPAMAATTTSLSAFSPA
ncbi:hypothetical protein EYW49_20740 [Siculibacillus lacustris]|uniref:Uncharacterized protein n=1 Tax=Siculibacillus lacustris TaxID=1549641 RepID=A0A4Q9VF32_9HYPH|nr:hypothetical protein [Siculibacillus lacustris]TBW33283.1 hypothetical protein EYW49_20740 [Siculibacillus lacustris]